MKRWTSLLFILVAAVAPASAAARDYRDRPPEDEVIYFLLVDRFANGDPSNDRGGASGDRTATGFDPTDADFYQGGDLKGVLDRLDYIRNLGATTIWLSPVFRNRWVQSGAHGTSAGYHGYWITDFTDVDPHFGTRADLKRLVDAAHARGMKIYLDIVVNHTADVIRYRECDACPYRSEADYPYTRRGGPEGAPINDGFAGGEDAPRTAANFARLTRPDYAYTPYVPEGLEHVKKPEWLNDPIYYHDRGESTFEGESSLTGDFAGLDDVMTENPRVVAGFVEIYSAWVRDFRVDGFRVDTARHVDDAFWRAFTPAILATARAAGIPNFHVFGEVADPDPAMLAAHTRDGGLPYVLDFAFARAAREVVAGRAGPSLLRRTFAADVDYEGGAASALRLATFLGNHDQGRFAYFLERAAPGATRDELLRRAALGHALMLLSRGVPVVYYGDEQGMIGAGEYARSRETMFASRVPSYLAEVDLGRDRPVADHFDASHPLYRAVAEAAALRAAHPGLRRGEQEVRLAGNEPGLYAFARTDPADGRYLVAINTSAEPRAANVAVGAEYRRWTSLRGAASPEVVAPGVVRVSVPALDYVVCRAPSERLRPRPRRAGYLKTTSASAATITTTATSATPTQIHGTPPATAFGAP